MDASSHYIHSSAKKEDPVFERPLRPELLSDFVGQERLRERLELALDAARRRDESMSHCIFCGPPGLGKTTLAHIVAKTMGSRICITSGPVIEKAGDLAGLLTSLKAKDVLFIDEIHRMSPQIEEYLYPAMEDYKLDLMIDTGPAARSVQLKLEPFTLVAATTRMGLLSAPLRSRFAFSFRLDFYPVETLAKIVIRSATLLKVSCDEKSAAAIAQCARGTPRIANNLLRWVRDFAQERNGGTIDTDIVRRAMDLLCVDTLGLDEIDIRILSHIIDYHRGGPVGVKTIAAAIGEEVESIEEVYEPYLLMQGLLRRTPRGREVTERAYQHLRRK